MAKWRDLTTGNRSTPILEEPPFLARALGVSEAIAPSLAAALILWTLLFFMLRVAGADSDLLPLLLAYGGIVVVVLSGNLVLSFSEAPLWPGRLLISVIIGFSATALFLLIGVFVVHLTAASTFVGWVIIIVLLSIARFNHATAGNLRQNAPDLLALFCIVAVSGFVCRHAAAGELLIEAQGYMESWWDQYIHGTTIAQFGDPLAIGRQKLLLSDQPLEYYHYGIYLLPAILLGLFHLSGLVAAGAILMPFGLVIGAAGAYALASALANRWAGVLVLAMLFLLPDSAAYGLKNGIFSFQWMVLASPGVGYGLGVAAASVVCANRWWITGERFWVALSLILAFVLSQMRIQIFILFIPTLLLSLVLMMPIVRRNWKQLIAATVLVAVTVLLLMLTLEPVRSTVSKSVGSFLLFAHTMQAPTGYDGFYNWALQNLSTNFSIALGILLLIPAVLGIFVVLYPVAAGLSLRRTGFGPIDAIPISLILFYMALMLLSPSLEFGHRPYVLVYMLVAVFTAIYVVHLTPLRHSVGRTTAANLAMSLVAAASISLLAISGFDPGRPRFGWGLAPYNLPIDPSVLRVATFLRHEAKPGDTVALVPVAAGAFVDSATILTSLTNVPNYLACPVCVTYHHHGSTAENRLRYLQQVEAAPTLGEAYRILRRVGITWYIVLGPSRLPSDPHLAGALLQVPFGTVYHVPTAPISGHTD